MRSLSLRAAVATRMRLWDQIKRALRGPRQTQNLDWPPAHDPNHAEAGRQSSTIAACQARGKVYFFQSNKKGRREGTPRAASALGSVLLASCPHAASSPRARTLRSCLSSLCCDFASELWALGTGHHGGTETWSERQINGYREGARIGSVSVTHWFESCHRCRDDTWLGHGGISWNSCDCRRIQVAPKQGRSDVLLLIG